MIVRLIGISKMEDKNARKTGKPINANMCYIAYKSEYVNGLITKEIFISSNLLPYAEAEIGGEYDILTDFNGRISKVTLTKPTVKQ